MSTTRGKQPINPLLVKSGKHKGLQLNGLTKREYFAIKIASAIESNPDPYIETGKTTQQIAVDRADALIEELNKD